MINDSSDCIFTKNKLCMVHLRKIIIYLLTGIFLLFVLQLGLLENISQYLYSIRNQYFSTFDYHYDDFIPYLPLVIMLGLKLNGVKSRSSWKEMLLTSLLSFALMWLVVYLIKTFTGVIRPDVSDALSFPSGHTATAFTAACLLYKEYGSRFSWITICAFLPAVLTGITRILNNKHWLSDVAGGMVVGIIVVEILYLSRREPGK